MPLLTFRGWAGGMNRRQPKDQIGDTEVVTAENLELDERANLRTRPGCKNISSTATGMAKRVTSIFYYEKSDGTDAVFATEDADVRRWNDATDWPTLSLSAVAGEEPCVTNPCVLPSDKPYYWRVFNDKAIAVNGDSTGGTTVNAFKIDSTAASPVLKRLSSDAAQPFLKYIEVANNRVFGVVADTPNVLVASKLGDAEGADAWSATGIAGFYSVNVGGDEGGRITAIRLYRDQLVVFKRRRIYSVFFGSPNTDTSQWEVRQLIGNVGCISQNSIQEVLGDLIFLSDEGLVSLRRLLSSGGDIERALLSEKIPALRQVPRAREDYPSVLLPERQQYWISVPTDTSTINERTYVMDYSLLSVNGTVAFSYFTGGPTGASLAQVIDGNGDIRVFIGKEVSGGSSAVWRIRNNAECTADGAGCFRDDAAAYTSIVDFKATNFNEPLVRKQIHRWGIEFGSLTDPLAVTVFMSIDGDDANARTWNLSFSGLVSGAQWDVDNWDAGLWASEVSPNTDAWRKVAGVRRFQQVQLSVRRSVIDQAMVVKNLSVEVSRLTHRKASDV